jgi:hypothetical protein
MKAFGSETLSCVDVLGMFVEMVLEPANILMAEVECFKHLQDLARHLSKSTYEHAHPALEACRKHHQAFVALYPLCAKPKLHYLWHSILSWIKFGHLIACLGAESEHKLPKRIMHFAYKNCTKTALAYWLRQILEAVQDPTTYQQTFMPQHCKQCNYRVTIGTHVVDIVQYSLQLTTPTGTYHKGDMLQWSTPGNSIGKAKCFLKVRTGGEMQFVAVVEQYLPVAGGDLLWQAKDLVYVCTSVVVGSIPFLEDGDYVRPRTRWL